jgi:transcriptional regulator with XRE-family HTH domain
MRAMERRVLLKKMDKEMRHYRLAARAKNPTNELLRTVRKVLRVPMKEMAEKMGIVESALFQMEDREGTGSITLRSLDRMAGAMDCKVVYGVVPLNGKTLEELAEERLWREVLGKDSETASQQVSKSASRQVSESAIQSVEAGGAANKAAA